MFNLDKRIDISSDISFNLSKIRWSSITLLVFIADGFTLKFLPMALPLESIIIDGVLRYGIPDNELENGVDCGLEYGIDCVIMDGGGM